MTQEAPDLLLMPSPAAKIIQSTVWRWVFSMDYIWYLPTLTPCRFSWRVEQMEESFPWSPFRSGLSGLWACRPENAVETSYIDYVSRPSAHTVSRHDLAFVVMSGRRNDQSIFTSVTPPCFLEEASNCLLGVWQHPELTACYTDYGRYGPGHEIY